MQQYLKGRSAIVTGAGRGKQKVPEIMKGATSVAPVVKPSEVQHATRR